MFGAALMFVAGEGFVNHLLDFFGRSLLVLLEVTPVRL
jgi:hypothetical protein